MGNLQCGDLCNNVSDKKQILQIEVAPRYDPTDWNKEEQKTAAPSKIQGSRTIEHEYDDSILKDNNQHKKDQKASADDEKASIDVDLKLPPIEVMMEQNHYIVPHSLVVSRVTDKVQLLLKKQFPTSPLNNNDARWCLLNSGNYYNGQLKNQNPFGIGTYLLSDKVFYGQANNNRPQGMGVLLSDNYIFKGEFQKGKAEGQATIQSQNFNAKGIFKEGQIKNGKIIGKEYVYQGQFLQNQPSGKGVYRSSSNISYDGEFKKGKFQGQGTYTCQEYTYKGSFLNGLKDGQGVISYATGQVKRKKGIWSQDRLVKVFD